jgi:hypothetical protein
MPNKRLVSAVAVVAAIATFVLGRVIWPDDPAALQPAASLLPHFMFLAAVTSVGFGVGLTLLLFGKPAFDRLPNLAPKWRTAAWLSASWLLVSWWPHENMHRVHHAEDFVGLLKIEYAFHLTLILTTLFVVKALLAVTLPAGKTPAKP